MIFELAQDLHLAATILPVDHPHHHMLELLEDTIRCDIHFIHRHPTTLFQCLWNSCWWHDCPETVKHYEFPEADRGSDQLPWRRPDEQLSALLQAWRKAKETAELDHYWVRSLRPPSSPIGNQELRVFRGFKGVVQSVDISPDGRQILTCHGHPDNTVRIWDIDSAQVLRAFKTHTGDLSCACYSPDGIKVAVTSIYDPLVVVCDTLSGAILFKFHGCNSIEGKVAGASCVAFSPDGEKIAVGANDQILRVWDLRSGKACLHLEGHKDSIKKVVFSPDSRFIASASFDKTVRIWYSENGQQVGCLRGHTAWVTGLAYSPDGQTIASGSHDKTIRLWNTQTGQEITRLEGHTDPVVSVSFSTDGKLIASGAFENGVRIWDVPTGKLLKYMQGHQNSITEVRFHSDGRQLVSSSWDETVRLWDIHKTPSSRHLLGSQQELSSVVISPLNDHVATGSRQGQLELWDANSGILLLSLRAHQEAITNVAFSPDGKQVVSGSRDTTIRIWNVETGQMMLDLGKHKLWPVWLTFTIDGLRIVCLFYDDEVRTWDTQTGNCERIASGSSAFLREAHIPNYIREWKGAWDIETLFEDSDTLQPLAWFPDPLYHFAWSVLTRRWAGFSFMGRYLYLLTLEGWAVTPGCKRDNSMHIPKIHSERYP